jgi:hypothetical protein
MAHRPGYYGPLPSSTERNSTNPGSPFLPQEYNVTGHPPFSEPSSVSTEAEEGMTASEIDEALSAEAAIGTALC